MISSNAHKYPISAQCRILGIARSSYYFCIDNPPKGRIHDEDISASVERIYKENRSVYGTRKIKIKLEAEGKCASRKRIGRVMANLGLKSAYTKNNFRPGKSTVNESNCPDLLKRDFNGKKPLEALVSDLTYVRVADKWAYTCLFLDLANREIVGHAASAHKDAKLVKAALASMDENLFDVGIFHTDRGSEFDNMEIDELLDFFGIKRSLSRKSNPWDNAVSEATFKLYKAEFAYREHFGTLHELQVKLSDYVHWFNNIRIHSTLGYLTPIEFKDRGLIILNDS